MQDAHTAYSVDLATMLAARYHEAQQWSAAQTATATAPDESRLLRRRDGATVEVVNGELVLNGTIPIIPKKPKEDAGGS